MWTDAGKKDPTEHDPLPSSTYRALTRRKRFEVLDEKGLMVVATIPETQVELVVMSAIFKVTLVVNHDGS